MADNTRPPVAIRIVRPYQSEDEFLDNELETVGKTSVILIGAHSRPTGVILRFEVTLASGATILRGEGRVLAHKEHAFRGQPGLSLRFTRLDPKSKALVDRAAAIREAKNAGDVAPASARNPSLSPPEAAKIGPLSTPRPAADPPSSPTATTADPPSSPAATAAAAPPASRPSAPPPSPSQPSAPPPSPTPPEPAPRSRRSAADAAIADALTAETPPPSRPIRRRSAPPPDPRLSSLPPQPPPVIAKGEPPRASAPPAPPPSPAPFAAPPPTVHVDRPANRDDLLARLRHRASSLPRERVDDILAKR